MSKINIYTPKKIDALIILANLMDKFGKINSESEERVNKALDIYSGLKVPPTLVTCGWAYRTDNNIPIAVAFKNFIIENFDINPEKICIEINSRDTVGDAYFTKVNHAEKCSWRNIVVVTSDYHVKRTIEIFNFVYGPQFNIEVVGAETLKKNEILLSNENKSIVAFRETFKNVSEGNSEAIFQRMCDSHPYYNGVSYPSFYKHTNKFN
jgi:hypothetical protein